MKKISIFLFLFVFFFLVPKTFASTGSFNLKHTFDMKDLTFNLSNTKAQVVSANTPSPDVTSCYEDSCDGLLPHATDCWQQGLVLKESVPMIETEGSHKGRTDGYIRLYTSQSGSTHCNTGW